MPKKTQDKDLLIEELSEMLTDLQEQNRSKDKIIKDLKKRESSLKKQVDLFYETDALHELIEIKKEEKEKEALRKEYKKLKKQWLCWKCGRGYLEIHTINTLAGEKYYRRCSNCDHRTGAKLIIKNQPKGIFAEDQ